MKLTNEIQSLLLEIQLDADEQLEDIVLDAQEYGMECIIEMVTPKLTPEDIIVLDEMIDDDKSVDELDEWLGTKIEDYDSYVNKALEMVKEYLQWEEEELTEELS